MRQPMFTRMLITLSLAAACAAPAGAQVHRRGAARAPDTTVCRTAKGRICRSTTEVNRFKKLTGFPKGRPGWIVDHMKPLECGGADNVSNLQWQTVAEAKAKDKIEGDCSRWVR